ncbi:MAG: hypothetical protein CM15mP120_13820 [Pseudomonadota bacterium]|nr:MAG: hypothetical protein CM15mP120_13820 [Pseudomonadota bacterium]
MLGATALFGVFFSSGVGTLSFISDNISAIRRNFLGAIIGVTNWQPRAPPRGKGQGVEADFGVTTMRLFSAAHIRQDVIYRKMASQFSHGRQ